MLLLAGGVAIPKGAAGRGEDGAQAGRRGQGQRENPQPKLKKGYKNRSELGGRVQPTNLLTMRKLQE